jgi:general secretion pathway protein A
MHTEFYNLQEDPFRLTSDPRFFYLAEPHRLALTTFLETVMRHKGFLVMSGPIGTGKTTVLHAGLQILTERAATGSPLASAFILDPMLSRQELLEMILAEFEVPCTSTSKPARLAALHRMLLDMQRRGGTSVLIIDEAHLLSPELLEEIRLLSNADTHHEKLIQIVLCGQPELLPILQRPELRALRQRIAGSCSLRPLSRSEMCAYIAERLYTAGFRGSNLPFPAATLEDIYRYSQGVPRLINLLCDSCLTIGCKTGRPQIQKDIVEEAAVQLGLDETQSQFQPQAQPQPPPQAQPRPQSPPLVQSQPVAEVAGDLMPVRSNNGGNFANPTIVHSTVNVLIERIVVPVSSAQSGRSTNDAVNSTVDVLIQTMKRRLTSATE